MSRCPGIVEHTYLDINNNDLRVNKTRFQRIIINVVTTKLISFNNALESTIKGEKQDEGNLPVPSFYEFVQNSIRLHKFHAARRTLEASFV